jgi:hypothetical protein
VLASFAAGAVLAQTGLGPIGTLQGRVDSNNALMVTAAASGTTGAATAPIANLQGKVDSSNNLLVSVGAGTMTPAVVTVSGAAPTSGSGTGITVNTTGGVQTTTYSVTVDKSAFVCNATDCDLTIATLAADTEMVWPYAKLTTTFACSATCTTATLSLLTGKGAGGAEYLASFDADAATGVFGDADAELGSLMTRAAAINGGTYNTASQAVVLRLHSGAGAIGNGTVTNLSQGSVTIYFTTMRKP